MVAVLEFGCFVLSCEAFMPDWLLGSVIVLWLRVQAFIWSSELGKRSSGRNMKFRDVAIASTC